MQELLAFVAAGGSVTTVILLYYIYKIEPRLRSMERTQLQGQQVDLMKLAKELSHPAFKEKSETLLKDVEKQLAEK